MVDNGWESIYSDRGEIHTEILKVVLDFSAILKEKQLINIIDLGCGTGRHSIYLAENGFKIDAVDISPKGIEIAKHITDSRGLDNISFFVCDMFQRQFAENHYDAALCILAIDHGTSSQISKFIKNVFSALKPGGYFLANFLSDKDETYGRGLRIEKGTYVDSIPGEVGIMHHYTNQLELNGYFEDFKSKEIEIGDLTFKDQSGSLYETKLFNVQAVK